MKKWSLVRFYSSKKGTRKQLEHICAERYAPELGAFNLDAQREISCDDITDHINWLLGKWNQMGIESIVTRTFDRPSVHPFSD